MLYWCSVAEPIRGEEQQEDGTMGVQKEDVEKFLNGNPAFAKQYFTKKLDSAALSKISGLPQKQIDFGHFQDLSQVNMRFGKKEQIRT